MAGPGAMAGFAGSAIGALAGYFGAKRQNAANRAEAKRNRDFQERMSSTAHQREIKDLRLAGLNPILSATGGAGSSTPGGAMARMENTGKDVASNISKTAQIAAQIANTQSSTDLNRKQALVAAKQVDYVTAQTLHQINSAQGVSINNALQTQLVEYFGKPGMLEGKHMGAAMQPIGIGAAMLEDLYNKLTRDSPTGASRLPPRPIKPNRIQGNRNNKRYGSKK